MSDLIDAIALIASFGSMIVAIIAFVRARPIEKQQYDTESMLKAFDLLSDTKFLDAKTRVAISYWDSKDNGKKAIFKGGTIEDDSNHLRNHFDKTCVLYELGLLDKTNFLRVYAGNIAVSWQLLEEDIKEDQKVNPKTCFYFEKVAKEIINNWDKSHDKSEPVPRPYRPSAKGFAGSVSR